MTIIEFYDKVSIENIAGSILLNPDKLILIGDGGMEMENSKNIYQSILVNRELRTKVECLYIDKNNLTSIVKVLDFIATNFDDCIFDLTGGDELYLVGVGVVMEKHSGRVKCHRFNFIENTLYAFDADGKISTSAPLSLSIEENISFCGGRLVTDTSRELYTFNWEFTDDFINDIGLMWSICKKHTGQWNSQISTLGSMYSFFGEKDKISMDFSVSLSKERFSDAGLEYKSFPWIIAQLEGCKLIKYSNNYGHISIEFKNEQIKRVLTTAGQLLEVYVASILQTVKDKDGAPIYNDVRVGVIIDWDQDFKDEFRTINEIDVIAMKGAIPVFISCKNGNFDVNELYKLNTVSRRFGGEYVKKVLAASKPYIGNPRYSPLVSRIEDMGIRFIDRISEIEKQDLEKILASLWL